MERKLANQNMGDYVKERIKCDLESIQPKAVLELKKSSLGTPSISCHAMSCHAMLPPTKAKVKVSRVQTQKRTNFKPPASPPPPVHEELTGRPPYRAQGLKGWHILGPTVPCRGIEHGH